MSPKTPPNSTPEIGGFPSHFKVTFPLSPLSPPHIHPQNHGRSPPQHHTPPPKPFLIHHRCLPLPAMPRRREIWPSSPPQPSKWRCKLVHLPNFAQDAELRRRYGVRWSFHRLGCIGLVPFGTGAVGEAGGLNATTHKWQICS